MKINLGCDHKNSTARELRHLVLLFSRGGFAGHEAEDGRQWSSESLRLTACFALAEQASSFVVRIRVGSV